MMIDRLEGNSELKTSVRLMLGGRRMTHSVLLVGEEGLGTGFAARCVAADYLYPNGGAPAEALLRGECCRAVAKVWARPVFFAIGNDATARPERARSSTRASVQHRPTRSVKSTQAQRAR